MLKLQRIKEKHLILQIMAERSVKARHDIDEEVLEGYMKH